MISEAISFTPEENELMKGLDENLALLEVGYYQFGLASGKFVCSRGYLKIHELKRGYESLQAFYERVHPDDRKAYQQHISNLSSEVASAPVIPSVAREIRYRIIGTNKTETKVIREITKPHISHNTVEGFSGVIQVVRNEEVYAARISELMREVEKLKKDLEESHRLAELGTWEYDVIHDVQKWSAGQYSIYEVDEAPKTLHEYLEFVHPEDVAGLTRLFSAFLEDEADQKSSPYFFRIVSKKTGKIKYVKSVLNASYENGKLICFKGINQDVTEEWLREAELRKSNELLRESQKLAGLGGWEYNCVEDILTWLPGEAEHYEVDDAPKTFEEYLGYIHPDDRHILIANLQRHFAGLNEPVLSTFRIQTPTGKVKTMASTVVPVYSGGKLIKYKGVTQDITLRIRRETELTEAKDQLISSQKLAKMGSWEIHSNGEILKWSEGLSEIYELEEQEVPESLESYLSLVHPDDSSLVSENFAELWRGSGDLHYHFRIVPRRTSKIKVLETHLELICEQGKPVSIKGTQVDISEHRTLIERLEKVTEDLRVANKDLSDTQENLRETQRIAGIGSWSLDLASNKIEWSDELKLLSEFPADIEPTVENFFDIIHPADVCQARQIFESFKRTFSENPNAELRSQLRIRTFVTRKLKHIAFTTKAVQRNNAVIGYKGVLKDVTHEVNQHNELIVLHDDLLEIQRHGGLGIWSTDLKTNKQFWSEGTRAIYELDPDSPVPDVEKYFSEFVLPEDQERLYQFALSPLEDKGHITFRIRTTSGRIKHIYSVSKPIFEGNEAVGLKGIALDITKLKEHEETIRIYSEDLIESQRLSKTGSWKYDIRSDKITASEGWMDIFEIKGTIGELGFQGFSKLIHHEDEHVAGDVIAYFSHGNQGEKEVEFKIQTPPGARKYVKVVAKPITENGVLTGIKGSVIDVTLYKEYEQEILRSQEQLKLLFSTMTQGVIYRNSAGKIVHLNPAAERILGPRNSNADFDFSLFDLGGRALDPAQYPFVSVQENGIPIRGKTLRLVNRVDNSEKWVKFDSFPVATDQSLVFCIFEDVSTVRKSYELLKQSEERFSNVFNYSGIGMAILSRDAVFENVNGQLKRITGYDAEDLLKIDLFEVTHSDDRALERERIRRLLSNELQVLHCEKRIVTKVGTIKWVTQTISCIHDGRGAPLYIVVQMHDITEKVLAEKAVFDYQQKFISAFHKSSVGMMMGNLAGRFLEVNDSVCRLLGYTKNELVGTTMFEITHDEEKQIEVEYEAKLLKNEINGFTIEKRFIHKSGRLVYGLVTVNLIKNADGNPVSIISQIQDITKQVINQKQIRVEKEKLEHIFKFSGIGMMLANSEGKIIEINRALCNMCGRSEEEMVGFCISDLPHAHDREKFQVQLHALLANQCEQFTLEQRYTSANGDVIHVLATCSVIENTDVHEKYVLAQIQNISDLKKEQATRLESEARYRYVVENALMGIGISKGTRIFYANPALLKIFGYETLAEISEKSLIDLATPVTKKVIESRVEQLRKGQQVPDVYLGEFSTRTGEIKTLEVQAKTITIANEPYRMAIISDLTEKLKLERELRETQKIFEQAQSFAQLGSWRWKVATDELYWSNSIYKLFGLRNKKIGKVTLEHFLRAIHPDDRARVSEAIQRSLALNSPYDVEHRILLRSGKTRWIHEKGNVVRDREGNSTEMFGIVREITQSKLISEELKKSKDQYKLLAESGKELICLHSLEGNFLYASPALKSLLGYNPKRIPKSLKSVELVHPDDRTKFNESINKAIAEKDEVLIDQIRFLHKNGNYVCCEKSIKAVVDQNNRVVSLRSLTRNIEGRMAYERRLRDANYELQKTMIELREMSQAKENFLSIMSHEIRTPLNSVIGLSNLLIKRTPRDDQAEVLKALKSSADTLMNLVNDILDFNKIRSGNVVLEKICFNLVEFLHQQYNSFKISAQDKGLEFAVQIDPRIPPLIEGDVNRLNQIFTNLLTNAIKFTDTGKVKVSAELVSIDDSFCQVCFKVEDTGIGIPNEKIDSVFEPFHQSDAHITRKYGGTGLGLSIVKSLAVLMNGSVSLQSEFGKGSIFTVLIQFTKGSARAVQQPKPQATRIDQIPHLKLIDVLYVEDVESNRFLIEQLLRDNSIACTCAASATEALRLTKGRKFDVILMDIQMPEMDGYEASKRIRAQEKGKNRKTPVIAFTAEPYSLELKARTVLHGIKYVISKPFQPDFLIEKISVYAKIGKAKRVIFSYSYYEDIFSHDARKLDEIKKALRKDVSRLVRNLSKKNRMKDLEGIQQEAHRIRPIMKNISCIELVDLLNSLRYHESYNREVNKVCRKVITLTQKLLKAMAAENRR